MIVDDTFTGADGALPNVNLWTITVGSPVIDTNRLKLSNVNSGTIRSRYWFTGNFDVQIDFDCGTDPATNSWGLDLMIYRDSTHRAYFRTGYTESAKVYQRGYVDGGSWSYANYTRTQTPTGKLRISRSSNTFTVYFWNGSTWTSKSTFNVGSAGDIIFVELGIAKWDTNPSNIGYFDNLVLNSGTPLFPSYSDSIVLTLSGTLTHGNVVNFLESKTFNVGSIIVPSSQMDFLSALALNVNNSILEAGDLPFTQLSFLASAGIESEDSGMDFLDSIILSTAAKISFFDKFWHRKPINANPSVDWLSFNDLGTWPFIPQPTKPHYNEGNEISNLGNDVWNTIISGIPITPKHRPWCGYWFKRPVSGGGGDDGGGIVPTTQAPIPISPDPETCVGCWGGSGNAFCVSGLPMEVTPQIVCNLDPLVSAVIRSGPGTVTLIAGVATFYPTASSATTIIEFTTKFGYKCFVWIFSTECCLGWIQYTIGEMDIGESQTISVSSSVGGVLYEWTIDGIGYFDNGLQTDQGQYVTFTIGANPDCDTDLEITLSCNGAWMDSLTITFPPCTGTIAQGSMEMHLYDYTDLSVANPIVGCIYTWEIDPDSENGDAHFGSSQTGENFGTIKTGNVVTFFAPTENPDCNLAPKVNLYACKDTDNEVKLDTIDITFEECSGTLGYTTLQMEIYEHQDLWVVDPIQDCIYTWELAMGSGGSLNNTTGLQVQYTAPAANPNCYDNATINLYTCKGGTGEILLDTITIAINAALPIPNTPAYYITEMHGSGCQWTYGAYAFKCDGTPWGGWQDCCGCNCSVCPDCCCYPYDNCNGCGPLPPGGMLLHCTSGELQTYCSGVGGGGTCTTHNMPYPGTYDVRTPAMLAAGCCPEALL